MVAVMQSRLGVVKIPQLFIFAFIRNHFVIHLLNVVVAALGGMCLLIGFDGIHLYAVTLLGAAVLLTVYDYESTIVDSLQPDLFVVPIDDYETFVFHTFGDRNLVH